MVNASNSVNLYSKNYPSSGAYVLTASFVENSTNTEKNTSNLTVTASLTSGSVNWSSSYNSKIVVYWHDNKENYDRYVAELSFAGISKNDTKTASGTIDVTHKDDGSLSGYAYAVFEKGSTTSNYAPSSGSVTTSWTELTKINRKANLLTAPNFNDEENPTITYENPAGNAVDTIKTCISWTGGDDIPYREISKAGGSYTFNFTDEERTKLRKAFTTDELNVTFYVTTVINGVTLYSTLQRKATLINANPEFSNFAFKDVNSVTVALTGNNQNIIKGYSNVEVTIPIASKATPKKEAIMKSYRFTCGDKSADISYSDEEDVNGTISGVPNGTFTVYATDSRNNSTKVDKLANQVVEYTPLTKGNIDIVRRNGVSEEVTLTFEGTFYPVNFGEVSNSIKPAIFRFRIAKSNDEWTERQIDVNIDGARFSFTGLVEGDTDTKGFNISNSYEVEVVVSDELSSVTFTDTFGSGVPNLAYHKNGVGIMGKYDDEVGGPLQVGGKQVVEAGEGYIKYYDGTMICYGTKEVTLANEGTWGSLYSYVINDVVTFPETFTKIESVIVNSCDYNIQTFWAFFIQRVIFTETGIIAIHAARPNSGNEQPGNICYQAIGKWK